MVVKIANQKMLVNQKELFTHEVLFKKNISYPIEAPTIIPDTDNGKVRRRAAFM